MCTNDLTQLESIDTRDARALTQYLTVLDDVGRARGAPELYLVVSESGSEYLVDTRGEEGACECADHRHRGAQCKHLRRVAFATGEREIPPWVDTDALDEQLAEHVDATPQLAATDGGTRTVRDAAEGAEVVGLDGYDLEDVDGGLLVYEPTSEFREHLGREVRTGRRLVGVAEVTDRLALRGELARRGLDVGAAHDVVDLHRARD
jgi:hypothetical protein